MNIIKKIFNFNKESKKEIDVDMESIDNKIKQENVAEKEENISNVEENNIDKNVIYNIVELQNKPKIQDSISNEIKEIIEKVEKVTKGKSSIEKDELIEEVENILLEEKIKSKNINEKKLEEQKNKRELEKQIKIVKDIYGEISECSKINAAELKEDLEYEEFLNSTGHRYTVKLAEVLEDIEHTDLKKSLYDKLDNIYIEYETNVRRIIAKVVSTEEEIKIITREVGEFTNEVKNFTIYLNKIKSKGKIELKQQYDKLKRGRENLINKQKIYSQKEKKINEKVLVLNKEIKENIVKFSEIYEYILIYLEEKVDEIQIKLSTFTKDENMLKEFENNKQNIELLTDLKNVLRN